MFFKYSIFLTIFTTALFAADQTIMQCPEIEEQLIQKISALEALCIGNFTFNPSDPNSIRIADFREPTRKIDITVNQFRSYLMAAHGRIKHVLHPHPYPYHPVNPLSHPYEQYFCTSFIKNSPLVKEPIFPEEIEDNELIHILKENYEHRLSFSHWRLSHLKNMKNPNKLLQKCREIYDIVVEQKQPISSIRMIWRDLPPEIVVDPSKLTQQYELYCQNSAHPIQAKIAQMKSDKAHADFEDRQKAAAIAAQNKSGYCSVM